jgi:3-dehydroquinate synthase
LRCDKKALEYIVSRSAKIKADIVARDELDTKGLRIILNFGHTVGHAIEAAGGYAGKYNHGEAIAIGMVAASDIARRLGIIDRKTADRIEVLIKKAGLPVFAKGLRSDKIFLSLLHDKKFIRGRNRFVLPASIGKVKVVEDIPDNIVKYAIKDRIG